MVQMVWWCLAAEGVCHPSAAGQWLAEAPSSQVWSCAEPRTPGCSWLFSRQQAVGLRAPLLAPGAQGHVHILPSGVA